MSPTSLPPPKAILTSLCSTLPSHLDPTTATDNPILTAAAKPNLLTLHAFFPTLLLPALDLLDRRLVTRFTSPVDPADHKQTSGDDSVKNQKNRAVYYVRSNAARDGRSRYSRSGDGGGTSYEVRTRAWSCTCAAFAFSAYNGGGISPTYESFQRLVGLGSWGVSQDGDDEMLDMPTREEVNAKVEECQWGGAMLGDEEVPLCKHLLACVLVESWDVSAAMAEERVVGLEEMAGWAAGWGG